jgi:hypothetical protein
MTMTFMRTSLLTVLLVLSAGRASEAAPRPADFGAGVLVATPSCRTLQAMPLHVSALAGTRPTCCSGQAHCSQYLATTRIDRAHDLPHT